MKRSGALLAVLAVLVAATSCSGSDSGSPGTGHSTAARPDLGTDDVACPAVSVDRQVSAPFRAREAQAPHLDVDLTFVDLGKGDYCVAAVADGQGAVTRTVSYTLRLPQNGANYGERYGTDDAAGSDELLNFPFSFHVYGGCRPVTSRIVVHAADGDHEYAARTRVGPDCAG